MNLAMFLEFQNVIFNFTLRQNVRLHRKNKVITSLSWLMHLISDRFPQFPAPALLVFQFHDSLSSESLCLLFPCLKALLSLCLADSFSFISSHLKYYHLGEGLFDQPTYIRSSLSPDSSSSYYFNDDTLFGAFITNDSLSIFFFVYLFIIIRDTSFFFFLVIIVPDT